MKEIYLENPLQKEFILHLGTLGSLQYLENIPNPFFRAEIPGRFNLSGIEGRNRIKVVLDRDDPDGALDALLELISSFRISDEERTRTE